MTHVPRLFATVCLAGLVACGTSSPEPDETPASESTESKGAPDAPEVPAGDSSTQNSARAAAPMPRIPTVRAFGVPKLGTPTDKRRTKQANQHNDDGLRKLANEDYEQAMSAFARALDADPDHVLARYNLACTYARGGYPNQALFILHQLYDAYCETCAKSLAKAAGDPDFTSLRGDPTFELLTSTRTSGPVVEAHYLLGDVSPENLRILTRLPAISTDGTRIAYAAEYAGETAFVLTDIDGVWLAQHELGLTDTQYMDARAGDPFGTIIDDLVARARKFLGTDWVSFPNRGVKGDRGYQLGTLTVSLRGGTLTVADAGGRTDRIDVNDASDERHLVGAWANADYSVIAACIHSVAHGVDNEACTIVKRSPQ